MDEYRGQYGRYDNQEQHHQQHPIEPEPHMDSAPAGVLGLFPQFGAISGLMGEYLPFIIIAVVLVGLYLWFGKSGGGLGGLLGGFLK